MVIQISCAFFIITFSFIPHSQNVLLMMSVCVSFPLLGIYENRNLLPVVFFFTIISVQVSNDLTRSVIAALPPFSKYKLSCWSECLPLSPVSGDGHQTCALQFFTLLSIAFLQHLVTNCVSGGFSCKCDVFIFFNGCSIIMLVYKSANVFFLICVQGLCSAWYSA